MRRRASFVLRVGLSAGLLLLLLAQVDRPRLLRVLGQADPGAVLLVIALVTADRVLMAWKWWLLVRGREAAVSLWAAVRAYYLASFAGWFLPMTVGADVVRVAALAGGGRTAGLIASVVLERAVGALGQAVLAAIAVSLLLARGLGVGPAGGGVWIAFAAVVVAIALFPLSFPVARSLADRLGGTGAWRLKLAALARAYADYGQARTLVLVFFGLTLLEGCLPVAVHLVAGRAVGLAPGVELYVATVPIAFLVARLPVSLGGIGVVELSFVYLAGLLGLARTEALSIALLAEVLTVIALLPGAVAYLWPVGPALTSPRRARVP